MNNARLALIEKYKKVFIKLNIAYRGDNLHLENRDQRKY